jgi:HSP20 family protein
MNYEKDISKPHLLFKLVIIITVKMALTNRVFSDALRDMQRAMATFSHPSLGLTNRQVSNPVTGPLFPSFFDTGYSNFPATDMVERPEAYEVHAEVPGYDKNNIKIEVPDSRTLVLSGSMNKETKSSGTDDETRMETDTEEEQSSAPDWWVNERVSGSFTRSFTFPKSINPDDIKATCENGVLKIIVPKTQREHKLIRID